MYKSFIKRIADFVLSLVALLLLAPLLLVVIVFLSFDFKKNVFFVQERPGLHGEIFKIYKFRTMNSKTDSNGKLLPDIQRLTRIGRFVRSTSLDELPQLINVLKGDMSLIGPRPLLVSYLSKYTEEQMRRHQVRPGITGWAQVNGRNAISWEEKFKLDVWYVDNISLCLDVKILLLTLRKVLRREAINSDVNHTMTKFN